MTLTIQLYSKDVFFKEEDTSKDLTSAKGDILYSISPYRNQINPTEFEVLPRTSMTNSPDCDIRDNIIAPHYYNFMRKSKTMDSPLTDAEKNLADIQEIDASKLNHQSLAEAFEDLHSSPNENGKITINVNRNKDLDMGELKGYTASSKGYDKVDFWVKVNHEIIKEGYVISLFDECYVEI